LGGILAEKVEEGELTILCGDLNVDFHQFEKMKKINENALEDTDEYNQLIRQLKRVCSVKDIFQCEYTISPFTFGVNGKDFPKHDSVLTDKEDFASFQTLDYIFELQNSNNKNQKLTVNSAKIEPFHVERRKYQTLSDHLGLTVSINYLK